MSDKIEKFGYGSVIQHGKLNDRVYLLKLEKKDFPGIIGYIEELGKTHNYSKLFCKVPFWAAPEFLSNGFITEVTVPKFFGGSTDAFFVSKFLNPQRFRQPEHDKLTLLSEILNSDFKDISEYKLNTGFKFTALKPNHTGEISEIYKQVFDSYPFPVFDPNYIDYTMKNDVQYFGVEFEGKLVALSSAEKDVKNKNAEMTDFATLPAYRGNNLSVILLGEMEKEMKKQGLKTLYTIARLNSPAMNKTFLKLQYRYAGTLIKNTNISGKIESMNVLYKHIF